MKYALDHSAEAARLERQSTFEAYSLEAEFKYFPQPMRGTILDAGCGTGLVGRYLLDRYPYLKVNGCDGSAHRLHEAKLQSREDQEFFEGSLENIPLPNNSYDGVVCRYVFEHLPNPIQVAQEFYRIIQPGGWVYIINFDGILFNLSHQSSKLREYLSQLENTLPFDLCIGRKIPQLLTQVGFKSVVWQVEATPFKGEELKRELELTQDRLNFAQAILQEHLGSKQAADDFTKLYTEEMMKTGNTLFYNKFIVRAVK